MRAPLGAEHAVGPSQIERVDLRQEQTMAQQARNCGQMSIQRLEVAEIHEMTIEYQIALIRPGNTLPVRAA